MDKKNLENIIPGSPSDFKRLYMLAEVFSAPVALRTSREPQVSDAAQLALQLKQKQDER